MRAAGEAPQARGTLPKPYMPGLHHAKSEEVRLLEDKLRDFKAENTLLGRLLTEAQADRQSQERALSESRAQCSNLQQQCQALQRQVDDLLSESRRQHSAHQQELSRLKQACQQQLQQLQQQADDKMASVRQHARETQATAASAAQITLEAMKQEAAAMVADVEADLNRQLQQQSRLVGQLQRRCTVLEGRVSSLKDSHSSSQQPGGVRTPAASHSSASSAMGLAAELVSVRRELAETNANHQALKAAAAAAAASLATHKQTAAQYRARLTKVRQELCTATAHQHELTAECAAQQQRINMLTGQLSAAEEAIRDLRKALCDAREQALKAQCTTVAEALQLAAKDAQQSNHPEEVGLLLRESQGSVATYIRVLEHAVREADAREAALTRAVSESQYLEDQARQLLGSSRTDQMAMQRALLQQVQQVHTLEAQRLSDIQEACRHEAALHTSSTPREVTSY